MDDPLVSCYAWKCFISSLHYWDAFWANHKKCNSVVKVTKSRKNLQRAIRCGLFFRPLGQDLHQKKRDPKWVFSIDFLSASSPPMVFLRKRKKKCSLHLPFGSETSQLLLSKQIIARNQYRFPWLCSILKICEVSKLSFNVIVAPTNISMYKKVRSRLFRSGRPFIRSSPLSK